MPYVILIYTDCTLGKRYINEQLTNPRKRYTSSNHIDPSTDSRRRNLTTHRRRNLNPRRETYLYTSDSFKATHARGSRSKPPTLRIRIVCGTCADKASERARARTRRGIRARSSWGASSTRWSAPSSPPSAAAAAASARVVRKRETVLVASGGAVGRSGRLYSRRGEVNPNAGAGLIGPKWPVVQ